MKAIEIAQNNHVSFDDILIICKELGISCGDENSDITGNDIFLVEKRIETVKGLRAKEAQEILRKNAERRDQKGKKIKLKRKVHVTKELIKEKPEEEEKKTGQETAEKPAAAAAATEKPRERKPFPDNRRGGEIRTLKEGAPRPARPAGDRPKPAPGRDLKNLFKPRTAPGGAPAAGGEKKKKVKLSAARTRPESVRRQRIKTRTSATRKTGRRPGKGETSISAGRRAGTGKSVPLRYRLPNRLI